MNFTVNNGEENEVSASMPNSKFHTTEQKIKTYRELLLEIQSVVDYEICELEFLRTEEQKKTKMTLSLLFPSQKQIKDGKYTIGSRVTLVVYNEGMRRYQCTTECYYGIIIDMREHNCTVVTKCGIYTTDCYSVSIEEHPQRKEKIDKFKRFIKKKK